MEKVKWLQEGRICWANTQHGQVLILLKYICNLNLSSSFYFAHVLIPLARFMNVPTQVTVRFVVQNLAVTKHLQQVMVGRPMFALTLAKSLINALKKHVARASRHQATSKSMFAHIQVPFYWWYVLISEFCHKWFWTVNHTWNVSFIFIHQTWEGNFATWRIKNFSSVNPFQTDRQTDITVSVMLPLKPPWTNLVYLCGVLFSIFCVLGPYFFKGQ
jgi:hypothetical protein